MTSSELPSPAWTPSKKIVALFVALALLPLIGYLGLPLMRPDMPASWEAVRIGMDRAEVLELAGGALEADPSDPGAERITTRGQAWFSEWAWILKVEFTEDGVLHDGSTSFLSEKYGMLYRTHPLTVAEDGER